MIACVVLGRMTAFDVRAHVPAVEFRSAAGSFGAIASADPLWHGPGVSDAKVNLFGFQPVEFIKILIVLFLAGYFAQRWEFLRVLERTASRAGEYYASTSTCRGSNTSARAAGGRGVCSCSSSCKRISDPRC